MRYRNHHAGCCGFSPTRPDGSEWPRVLTLPDGSTVHADTAAELMAELVGGYDGLDAAGRAESRERLAHRLAAAGQEARIAAAVARGDLDVASPDGAALADVLRASKSMSLLLELDEAPGEQAPWLARPTLVLVASGYAPHTDYPRITGNVCYIDPADDEALLTSLAQAQVLHYWRAEATTADAGGRP